MVVIIYNGLSSLRCLLMLKKKIKHLFENPPCEKDPAYPKWLSNDCCLITWLFNRMKKKVSYRIIFLKIAKEMWDILNEVYGNKKKIFRVFRIVWIVV